MERESFEDLEVARVLNDLFVSIKVDREERPDVDQVYMNACVALTGSGGWPLSAFLTHERKPFFVGTYFSRSDRGNHIGLLTLLTRLSRLWNENRSDVEHSSAQLVAALSQLGTRLESLDPQMPQIAANTLLRSFDRHFGGFGGAPKFPSPHNLLFLLRIGSGFSGAWQAVADTLDGMAAGGIRDQIGGGFCRYSTDAKWLAPHFEKMLYDNAMLCMAYIEAWQAMGRDEWRDIAQEIIRFLAREMTDELGGFYTAQDADSEGIEGKYYVWTPEEVQVVLGEEAGLRFCDFYDITRAGNFEGKSIPNYIGKTLSQEEMSFAHACLPRLYEARLKRVKPFCDEKILLSSNALMIATLAKAGAALEDETALAMAKKAAHFLLDRMRNGNRLLAVWKDGAASQPATLDGYAYLVWALIELYAATFAPFWLKEALAVNRWMLALFDADDGGLYLAGNDVDDLPIRTMDVHDGATPSGYSVAAMNLVRLSRYTGDYALEERAQALINRAAGEILQAPAGHTWLLAAMAYMQDGGTNVVIVQEDKANGFLAAVADFHPYMTVLLRQINSPMVQELDAAAPFTAGMGLMRGQAAAYVCHGGHCNRPVSDPLQLQRLICADGLTM